MWTAILGFLGGPLINGLVAAYRERLAAMTTQDRTAAELGIKAIEAEIAARQDARAIIIAEQGRWWTALPRALVQWAAAIFFVKCVVWDTVLGWGTTPALGGDVANTYGLIMAMWFGGRTLEKITGTIAGRFGK